MQHNHNARRRELRLMTDNGQLGKPFTRRAALQKVLNAPRSLFDSAIKHFVERPASPKRANLRDRVYGAVSTRIAC